MSSASSDARRPAPEPARIHARFPAADGRPRFTISLPRHLLADPGVRALADREHSGVGYKFATRCLLDSLLEDDDLFVDIGAHWGIMSLQAGSRGRIWGLAVEPLADNLPHLKRWLADNRLLDRIEVVYAAAAGSAGRGRLTAGGSMGSRIVRDLAGPVPLVTVDALVAARREHAGRRLIVKIDTAGGEAEAIAGMSRLLAARRVAAVIWARGPTDDGPAGHHRIQDLLGHFRDRGFTAWHFPDGERGGPLRPYDGSGGESGNILQLAAGLRARPCYGQDIAPPPPQPADHALDAALAARRLMARSLACGDAPGAAAALLRGAAALDPTIAELFDRLGTACRSQGRIADAVASHRHALALDPRNPDALANLGDLLREGGDFAAARALHRRALCGRPDDPGQARSIAQE